jgi:hypothetical protein
MGGDGLPTAADAQFFAVLSGIGDLIRGGGRIPVERNTTYGRVDREAISA